MLDFVGSDETLGLAAEVVAPDGLVMIVGESGGHLEIGYERPAIEAWVTTTAWGSIDELREVVRLARIGAVHAEVEVLGLADASVAHARLRAGDVSGRLVSCRDSRPTLSRRRGGSAGCGSPVAA